MDEGAPTGNAAADTDNPDEDDVRLKGDAIGDTLYSESWVLRTMIKLTQVTSISLNHSTMHSFIYVYSIL